MPSRVLRKSKPNSACAPGFRSLEAHRYHVAPANVDRFRTRVREWAEAFFASHTRDGKKGLSPSLSDPEPTILCVSHGAYLSALLGVLLSPPFSFAVGPGVDIKKSCLNTSLMRVRVHYDEDTNKWVGEILSWAEVTHMGGREQKLGVSDDIRAAFRQALGMGQVQA